MKAFKLSVPIFLIVIGIVFFIGTINLPKANLGNPNGPIYFPMGISILLLIFGIIYFFQELKHLDKDNEKIRQLFSGRVLKLVGWTTVLGIGYTIIFDRIGFLFSTILFLGALLFVINGVKKWKVNIIVSLVFSYASWYSFSELLGVSLP
ncbi:tripartite tricarboxylate transporter TctB family protein [Oceanobacillus sp. CF4.6]|uniref:tripartite tricarboxylate transporter TctB family protein n=1 Tax=Oceanobacillus sp. CF4.6 TaxID=3373080 RepID=UPI003EE5DA66